MGRPVLDRVPPRLSGPLSKVCPEQGNPKVCFACVLEGPAATAHTHLLSLPFQPNVRGQYRGHFRRRAESTVWPCGRDKRPELACGGFIVTFCHSVIQPVGLLCGHKGEQNSTVSAVRVWATQTNGQMRGNRKGRGDAGQREVKRRNHRECL